MSSVIRLICLETSSETIDFAAVVIRIMNEQQIDFFNV